MGTIGASFFQSLWESLVQTLWPFVTKRPFISHIDSSRFVWEPTVSHIRNHFFVSCTRSACNSKSLRAPLVLLLYFDVNPAIESLGNMKNPFPSSVVFAPTVHFLSLSTRWTFYFSWACDFTLLYQAQPYDDDRGILRLTKKATTLWSIKSAPSSLPTTGVVTEIVMYRFKTGRKNLIFHDMHVVWSRW